MSLLSALIVPQLEKQLIALEPELAQFLLEQVKTIGAELVAWVEEKLKAPQIEGGSNG